MNQIKFTPSIEYYVPARIPLAYIKVRDDYPENSIDLKYAEGNSLVVTPDYNLFFKRDRDLIEVAREEKREEIEASVVFWVHPKLQMFLPPLPKETLWQLRENIKRNGCIDSIKTSSDGAIIDGHNRISICTKEDIEFDWSILEALEPLKNMNPVLAWIGENQVGRRNQHETEFSRLYYGVALPILSLYANTDNPFARISQEKQQMALKWGVETGLVNKDDRKTAQLMRVFGEAINLIEDLWGAEERHEFLRSEPLLKTELRSWYGDYNENRDKLRSAIMYWLLKKSNKRTGKGNGGYQSRYESYLKWLEPGARFTVANSLIVGDEYEIKLLKNPPEDIDRTVWEMLSSPLILIAESGREMIVERPSSLNLIETVVVSEPEAIEEDEIEEVEDEELEEEVEDEEDDADDITEILEIPPSESSLSLNKEFRLLHKEENAIGFIDCAEPYLTELILEASNELTSKIVQSALDQGVSDDKIIDFYERNGADISKILVLLSEHLSYSS